MNSPVLIKADLSRLTDLRSISRQTFFEAFSAENTSENMNAFLDKEFAEDKIRNELSNLNSEF